MNADNRRSVDQLARQFAVAYIDGALTTDDDDEARRLLAELREIVLRSRHYHRALEADRARR